MWARRLRRHALAPLVAAGSLALSASPAAAGDGGFAAGPDLPLTQAASLAVGDFNNDARPDLAAVGNGIGKVAIYLQTGAGGLDAATPVAAGNSPGYVEVADFDRDGNDDLAVTNSIDARVSIRLGKGDGTFKTAPDVELVLQDAPLALVVGDFNNDARDDLAVAVAPIKPPNVVRVRLGTGAGTFTVANPAAVPGLGTLAVGDLNSDANEDLLYGTFGTSPAGALLGKGSGEFIPAGKDTSPFDPYPRGLALADFNADGRLDALGVTEATAAVRFGAGDGGFPMGQDVPLAQGADPRAVAVGDFNSDAREDFVVADAGGGGRVQVRLGDGAGGFGPAPEVPVGARPRDIAVADFNGDGNDDLATANYDGNSVSLRYGTGPAALEGNLLVNGGFEGPGWELGSGTGYLRYGAPSHAFTPSWRSAPRYGTGGGRLLWGGNSSATGGITTARQTVDVSASAGAIDAGRATANLSAYLGGTRAYPDTMRVQAEFLDAGGADLAVMGLGPVTPADRNNLTTLLYRAGTRALPPGTRAIRVLLISEDADKAYSSAMADNVKLTLTTTPATPGTGGTGGTGTPATAAFGPRTLVTLALASPRIRAGRPVRVRVRNGNAFAVSGRLRATARVHAAGSRRRVALPPRSLRVVPAGSSTVALTLPARARRELVRGGSLALRLTASVRDPAGGARRVTRTVRVGLKAGR